MKKIFALVLLVLSFSSLAYEIEPRYYATEFRIVDVRPMCPPTPTGATCMGLGSIVTVETTLQGCVDQLVYSDFELRHQRGGIEVHALGLGKQHPKSLTTRCIRPKTVRKTLTVNTPGKIFVINQEIER